MIHWGQQASKASSTKETCDMDTARVGLARAGARQANVYQALNLVREDVEPKAGRRK